MIVKVIAQRSKFLTFLHLYICLSVPFVMHKAERSMALTASVKQTFTETLAHSHMLIGTLKGEK